MRYPPLAGQPPLGFACVYNNASGFTRRSKKAPSTMAGLQAFVFMFGIISLMGTWDGLVRRHIRLSYDVMDMFILLRGLPAFLVGLLSAACLLFMCDLEVTATQTRVAGCPSFACVLQQTVLILFTTWQSIFVLLLVIAFFLYWLWGAFDLKGPYRRQMLAPGVCYKEKEVVEQVTQQLKSHHLPPLSDEQIIRAARTLIINLKMYVSFQSPRRVLSEQLDPKALADVYMIFNPSKRREADRESIQARRMMARTILRYYLGLHEQAVEKWPWIRRVLSY